jgi:hypothetical protein
MERGREKGGWLRKGGERERERENKTGKSRRKKKRKERHCF